jgi:hypothetical protein
MLASNQWLTRHASIRCQQRGVPLDLVALVLEHADRRVFVGDGVQSAMITRKRLKAATHPAVCAASKRLQGLIVLHDPIAGVVVTVLRGDRKAARRYRRRR